MKTSSDAQHAPDPLFEVRHLRVAIFDEDRALRDDESGLVDEFTEAGLAPGWVEVVPDLNFAVAPGEVLAIVGESGSGKTLSLLGSLDLNAPGARTIGGSSRLHGHQVLPMPRVERRFARLRRRRNRFASDDSDWRDLVGKRIGVLFQNPISSWTPIYMIGEQAGEVLEEHTDLSTEVITERVLDALGEVRLPQERKFFSFSNELSRGEAQRAMLAAALIKSPDLLVADEPLSGLDPPVAAAILDLIRDMLARRGMAMILVTHDLAAVASIADRVAVMYGGRIVEIGDAEEVFYRPQHPYTEGLLGSIPWQRERLRPIAGHPPRIVELPSGCAFAPRCPYAEPACTTAVPAAVASGGTTASCRLAGTIDLRGVRS